MRIKYNLERAQEEADKLVDKESAVIQNLEQIINERGFYPEALIKESGLSEAELNKYLVEIWISGRQGYQMRSFFDYVGKHKENFTGIGSLPEGETPYPVKSLFEETVKSKKPISEVLSILRDIFQIDDQKLRDIIVDTHQYYAGNQYQTTVFQALQKEFPLTTEESEHVALALISKKLEYAEKTFTSNDSRGEFDFESFNLVKQQFPEIVEILDRPEITTTGKKLIKEMLNYVCQRYKGGQSRDPKAVIPQIVRLRELAPQFFKDDFSEEVSKVWNRMAEYGSFGRTEYGGVDQMSKLLSVLDYPVEKTKPMARETLLEKLSKGYYPEGLIEYTKRFGMDDLLVDPEIINSAKEGRRKALFSLREESFQEFSNGFGFSEDWRSDPELIIIVRDGILKWFKGYNGFDEIERIREAWCIPQIANDEKIKETVRDTIIVGPHCPVGSWKKRMQTFNNWGIPLDSLRDHAKQYILGELNREGGRFDTYRVEECTRVFPEVMDSPDMQEITTRRVLDWKYEIESHNYYQLGKTISEILVLIKALQLRPELLDQWKASVATKLLADVKDQKQFKEFQEAQRYLKLPPDILKGMVVNSSLTYLSQGELRNALFLEKQFSIELSEANEEQLKKAGETGLAIAFQKGNLQNAIKIQEICHLSPEFFSQPEIQSKICQLLSDQFLGSGDIEKFKGKTNLFGIPIGLPLFNDTFAVADIFLRINIGELGGQGFNIENLSEADLKRLFMLVKEKSNEWRDERTIAGPFQSGAEIFGYKRMLEYIKRDGLSLHDSLHAFHDVLELFRASGLGESEFYGQVLQQVIMDDRGYSEGTAHHHLNAIAQTANKNIRKVIEGVQEYKEIERLQELAKTFISPQAVFASWANLKRYSELEQLLGQTEVFDELKALKAEGKEALYKYVETLAFHPDSKVNMGAVIQFWRDPESFLAAEASHTPCEIHDRKKPSNYINMPNLDLNASELRDALVEGKMDGLSAFTPLEIRYTIPTEEFKQEPLPDLVNKALGPNKKGIEGVARNSRKLFSELSKLLKPYGLSVVDYIQGKILPEGIDLSRQIENLLFDRGFGMKRPMIKTREFVARIGRKSDPEGAIAGDDTVNCMPFGDGKNTVYTFNPNTAQFVVRIVKADGKERTIAQSVLTKDMDIKTSIPDVITKLQQEGGHLEDILPADILTVAPVYAACDNVEVTPNYSDERHRQIIETIFKDFFREYMSRYATKEGLNSEKIPIGQGYTDALSQLPSEANTFAPQAPVSYSDKNGANVYMLDLTNEKGLDLIWQKTIRESGVKKRTEAPLPSFKGLGYLTFEDTLKVAYLEGKAYSDNQSLMQFLFNVENGLIAKDINNSAKNRSNMSLKYTDSGGRMRGYLLAWEGKLTDENVEQNAGEFFDQQCVYIIDVASDRENRIAGGRLIQGFADLYKQNYLDKGTAIPIYAQARETTSYQIVKKQLDKFGKDTGFNFELVELPTYKVGEDLMHPIIIRPVSIRT